MVEASQTTITGDICALSHARCKSLPGEMGKPHSANGADTLRLLNGASVREYPISDRCINGKWHLGFSVFFTEGLQVRILPIRRGTFFHEVLHTSRVELITGWPGRGASPGSIPGRSMRAQEISKKKGEERWK